MATYNGSVTANTSRYSCYITAIESEVNVANNTSKVTVAFHIVRSGWGWQTSASFSGNIRIDGTQYNFSYSPNWSAGSSGDVTIATASKVVTHNADGTKSCAVSAVWNTSGTYSCGTASATGTLALTRILRQANITSAPNFNDEENPTVHYTNPAGSSVTKLEMAIYTPIQTIEWREVSKTGTSYTFNLTETERNALRERLWNLNNKTIYFQLRTTIGGEQFLSYVERTLTIINANPQFSTFEYKDTNSTTVALTGNNQVNIGKYSNMEIKIPSANKMVARKSANPLKYNVIIGNQSKEILYGSGDVTGTINSANANIISVFAIDSRNNQTRVDKSISNIDYTEPLLQNIRFERKDGVGTTVVVTGGGKYNPVNFGAVANTIINIQYRRKLKSSETWEDWVSITGLFTIAGGTISNKTSNEIIGTTWELGAEYDVQIKATDRLSMHTLDNITVNSGNVLMDAIKNKGVSFGGLYDAEVGGALQVNGEQVGTTVVDTLTSTSATDALSANMGRVLDEKIINGLATFSRNTYTDDIILDDKVSYHATNKQEATKYNFNLVVLGLTLVINQEMEAGSNNIIATLPVELKPSGNMHISMSQIDGKSVRGYLRHDGTLRYIPAVAIPVGTEIGINVVYIV